ncbi:MAG: cell wall hydrolase [Bacillota bacterium]|nr:cell wall hydrolase [Bacillota bacterium]
MKRPRRHVGAVAALTRAAVVLVLAACVSIATVPVASAAAQASTPHRVQPGESLWSIAEAHGTTVTAIQALNGLWGQWTVYPGQKLWIPGPGERVHVVGPGETLAEIAGWYGLTAAELKADNGLTSDMIRPGQPLIIPASAGEGPAGADAPSAVAAAQGPKLSAAWTSTGAGVWLTQGERYLLAQLVTAEARGEPYVGQVAVAATVLNRMKSPIFPKTLAGVIYQPGQFEPVSNGSLYQPPTASALRAVDDALAGWDPTGGALYFFNPGKAYSTYLWTQRYLATIGRHVFLA